MNVQMRRLALVIAVVAGAGLLLRAIPDLAYDNGRFDSVLDGALALTMFIVALVFFLSKRLAGDADTGVCWAFASCGLIRFYGSAVDSESEIVWLHRLCSLSLAIMVYESSEYTSGPANPRRWTRLVYLTLVGLATVVTVSPSSFPSAVHVDHRVATLVVWLCALSSLVYGIAYLRAYATRAGARVSIDDRTLCSLALGIPAFYYAAYPVWSGQWWCFQAFELVATTYLTISLLKAHLADIARLRNELIEKTRHMERTLALVTHDIRNPLGVISTAAELIEGARPEEVGPMLSKIRANSTYINEMIQTLIESTGMIAGRALKLKYVEGDLAAVVRDSVEANHHAQVARVHLDLPAGAVRGYWPGDLKRVLNNLLSNAFKYGRPQTAVSVRLWCEDGCARLSVHNFGEPIDEAERAKVFQPYHRLDAARRGGVAGWGLGLSLVRNVTEAAGGRVWCDGDAEGTTFQIRLPLYSDVPRTQSVPP